MNQQSRQNRIWQLVALMTLVLGGLAFLLWLAVIPAPKTASTERDGVPDERARGDSSSSPSMRAEDAPRGGSSQRQLVEDDGRTLWASPTSGRPVDLKLVPPGAQLIVVVRPGELLAHAEGSKLLRALGPEFAKARFQWEQQTGTRLEDIEQLTIVFVPQETGAARTLWIVRLPADRDLAKLWPQAERIPGDKEVYRRGPWGFLISPSDSRRVFVMASPEDLDQVSTTMRTTPPLVRQIARLSRITDTARQITVLFTPQAALGAENGVFSGRLEQLRGPVSDFLGEGIEAGLFSGHLGQHAYAELRLISAADVGPHRLSQRWQQHLSELPAKVSDHVAGVVLDPYWQRLALRFPAMIGFLVEHTRVGVEDETVVINAVLPAAAVHNLMLAAELSLSSPEGDSREGDLRQTPAKAAWNLAQMLQYRMTLDIPQQSLELAMQELVQQAHDASQHMHGFRIQVIGEDLREAGVTRNQQIRDFRREQQTIAELLTGLVMQANPIPNVEHPSDLDQKLVWVAAPDPAAPEQRIVLVTTRQAAQRQGWPLPAVFRPAVSQDAPRE